MDKAYVVSVVRTAVGKSRAGSAIAHVRPDDMGVVAVREAVKRAGIPAEKIQDVVIGCAFPEAESGMNVGRIIALAAGLPDTVSGVTINRFCSSGLETMATVSAKIEVGMLDCAVAGGVESMSLIPMGGNKLLPNPSLVRNHPESYTSMGQCADNVAKDFGITREECDQWAYQSNMRAIAAIKEGRFKEEIVPLDVRGPKGMFVFDTDEGPRADTTVEGLGKLKPAFAASAALGVATAGNSSQTSCGAAASVIVSEKFLKEYNLKPMARLRGYAVGAGTPKYLGPAQVPAIEEACAMAGISVKDLGLIECNEAFSPQTLFVIKHFGLDLNIVNVNGGAIALGHPLGCTGTKLAATLIHEMRRRGVKYGMETMCIGTGMGAAGIFELCD
jgi:acetyl-CoA acyltransferase